MRHDRDQQILDHLANRGAARVIDLAQDLAVSDETIRRGLKRLEATGSVTRVHGGVMLKDWGPEPSFALRFAQNPGPKRHIAAAVAAAIAPGASLFLDVGTTSAHIAQALIHHRDLLVITNSLAVAHILTGVNGNRVFMAGGELRAHDGGAFGVEALGFVRQFQVGLAILSAAAIDPQAGFMLHDLREAEFSRAIIESAGAAWVAADATKFAAQAPIRIAPLSAFKRLYTDAAPPPETGRMLTASGVEVCVV
jgi:DeoR family transcriptional regulator, glycerol-3-phosphate regulon repressor